MHRLRVGVCVLFVTLIGAFAAPAHAGWPSPEKVLTTLAPLMGLDPNQVEAAKFALKEPQCATTIVSYTVAQDYSLVGFVGALKATKFQSLPQLPKMDAGSCKSYNPVQSAYVFVDSMGVKLLGASKADFFKDLLAEQIANGKSEVDSQIAAIPYLGTILSNWDCACDAAFKTDFPAEKMADGKVKAVIVILNKVKSGDIGGALEEMITSLGPEVACELGAQFTGVGSIPVVSTIASNACSSVAGKAVGWVVDGAGALAEGLGIVGGEHIPPDEYYKNKMAVYVGNADYMGWADVLYSNCYNYFEPSNMAASTAKKACAALRDRYVKESVGKIQWDKFQYDRNSYLAKNMKPYGNNAVLLDDGALAAMEAKVRATCVSYMQQNYPKANDYLIAHNDYYKGERIEDFCNGFNLDETRVPFQKTVTSQIAQTFAPYCKVGTARNSIVCEGGDPIQTCFSFLKSPCQKSSLKAGGMKIPCCMLGTAKASYDKEKEKSADNYAKKMAPYCYTSVKDPLRIVCTLPKAFEACQKMFSYEKNKDCKKAEKSYFGTALDMCCELDESKLDDVPGVKDVKKFVMTQNVMKKGSCAIGGTLETLSYDPRVVNCLSKPMESCQKKFPAECKQLPSGYVEAPCCERSIFGDNGVEERPYDPKDRPKDELALAEKAVKESNGQCEFGKTKDGKEDKFKVVCKSIESGKQCAKTIGRPADTPCNKKIKDGWVTSPCCERDASAMKANANEKPKPSDTPVQGAAKGALGGLAEEKSKGKPHVNKDSRLISIKLVSAKTKSGAGPFSTKDVSNLGSGRAARSSAPAASPVLRGGELTGTPALVDAPFNCTGKADGGYCGTGNKKDTQFNCYHGTFFNQIDCDTGCDTATGKCNK